VSRRALFLSFLIIALAAFLPPNHGRADETRVIQLKHRTARDIIPMIQPLMGPDDALSGTDYRLLIRTSERNFKEIDRLLSRLDVARQRLRITVEQTVAGNEASVSQSLSGEAHVGGNGRITLPARPSDNHGVVVQKDDLRYTANDRSSTAGNPIIQTVMTLDGQPAIIRIGQSMPRATTTVEQKRDGVTITQGIALQDATNGFEVVPHVHGDRVRIEIAPRLATFKNPATGLADFQDLNTTVDVRLGEWVDLGAILGDRNEVGRAILDSAATQSGERRTVRLKIE
jgi:type II secretory pathway component GspD/PulD (secretin)